MLAEPFSEEHDVLDWKLPLCGDQSEGNMLTPATGAALAYDHRRGILPCYAQSPEAQYPTVRSRNSRLSHLCFEFGSPISRKASVWMVGTQPLMPLATTISISSAVHSTFRRFHSVVTIQLGSMRPCVSHSS